MGYCDNKHKLLSMAVCFGGKIRKAHPNLVFGAPPTAAEPGDVALVPVSGNLEQEHAHTHAARSKFRTTAILIRLLGTAGFKYVLRAACWDPGAEGSSAYEYSFILNIIPRYNLVCDTTGNLAQ